MRIRDLFEKWSLTKLKVKTGVLDLEWAPSDVDKDAAWDLYVELLTRITTQPLAQGDGVESAALASIHRLFDLTRTTLKQHGRKAIGFSRIAVIVLNQVVRPFTAKWHRLAEEGAFSNEGQCSAFRVELGMLQEELRLYTGLLAELADVEDLTGMDEDG